MLNEKKRNGNARTHAKTGAHMHFTILVQILNKWFSFLFDLLGNFSLFLFIQFVSSIHNNFIEFSGKASFICVLVFVEYKPRSNQLFLGFVFSFFILCQQVNYNVEQIVSIKQTISVLSSSFFSFPFRSK